MFNVRNHCELIGRVAQKSRVIENQDGSKKVFGKVAVQDNYKTAGEFGTEFIEFTMYISKDGSNWAEDLKIGDIVAVEGHLTAKPYEKDGEKVYPALSVVADKVTPIARAKANKAGARKG